MWDLLYLCILLGSSQAASIKGPPVASQRTVFSVGRLGEEVRLTCPVEGNPPPMIEWLKEDEKIEDHTWTRFKLSRKSLKIKDASVEDSGRFYCRGINGFGREQITIDLIVIDPAEFPELGEGELPDILPPSLSPDTATAREEFEKKIGDTLTLTCSMHGKPAPKVVWYKNGVELLEGVEHSGDSASMLRIRNLRAEDTGTYSCLGRNMAGAASKEYRLTVRNTLLENPVFYNTPTNQTVHKGQSTSLDCRVQSALPPTIKWLKKLDPKERYKDVEVITVGKESYRIIDRRGADPGLLTVQTEVYVSQLDLLNVKPEDAGMYICFVTNSMGGFNYKPAFLTVITSPMDDPLVISLGIGLSVFTLVVILGLLVCLCRNRNKKPEEQEVGEVRSTLLCPPAPPPSLQQEPLYNKTGQPLPPPPTPVQWPLLYGQAGQSSYTDSSQYGGGNTYEVPRYADRNYTPADRVFAGIPRLSPAGQTSPGYAYSGYPRTHGCTVYSEDRH